jgi:predicted alpha/beta-hydrolase family hydrolase
MLQTPSLFVSGTKDVFGTIEELEAAVKLIPSRTELVKIEGAAHGLSKSGSAEAVAGVVRKSFVDFFA